MASSVRVRALLSLTLLLLSSIPSLASPDGRRDLLAYSVTSRRGRGRAREASPNCREMSRSECERHAEWCLWCTSDALDDACFGSAEAWRLPLQVILSPWTYSADGPPKITTTRNKRHIWSSTPTAIVDQVELNAPCF